MLVSFMLYLEEDFRSLGVFSSAYGENCPIGVTSGAAEAEERKKTLGYWTKNKHIASLGLEEEYLGNTCEMVRGTRDLLYRL